VTVELTLGDSLLRVVLFVEAARLIPCTFPSIGFVDGHLADSDIAAIANLVGDGDRLMWAVHAFLPELWALADNIELLELKFYLFRGYSANQVIDFRVVAKESSVSDLLHTVFLGTCDSVYFVAQIEVMTGVMEC
jgi:hypothetical protein